MWKPLKISEAIAKLLAIQEQEGDILICHTDSDQEGVPYSTWSEAIEIEEVECKLNGNPFKGKVVVIGHA